MTNLAEDVAVLARSTGAATSTPLVTTYVSAGNSGRITLVAMLGDMANETIDIAIWQGKGGSTDAKSLKAATQLSGSASANDSKTVIVSVDANDIDVDGGFTHVAGRCVTGAGVGGTVTLLLLGSDLRYGPASLVDAAEVIQIVP